MNIPTFDEATHTYYSDSGKPLPSVTQILSPLDAADLAALNPSVLKAASTRGAIVHDLCAQIDYGVDLADLEIIPELAGYIQAYKDFLRDYKPEWEMIEQPLAEENNLYTPYAGTLDRYGKIDGHTAIVDIKTVSSISRAAKLKYITQLVAYAELLHQNPDRYCILHLKADGTYRLINVYEDWRDVLDFPENYYHSLGDRKYNFANPSTLFCILKDLYYLTHKEK